MQTSLPLSGLPWDYFSPPRNRPPETTGIIYFPTRASAPCHQHTHAPQGITKDIAVIDRVGRVLVNYSSPRTATGGQSSQVWWGYELIFRLARLSRVWLAWIVKNVSSISGRVSMKKREGYVNSYGIKITPIGHSLHHWSTFLRTLRREGGGWRLSSSSWLQYQQGGGEGGGGIERVVIWCKLGEVLFRGHTQGGGGNNYVIT